MERLKIKYVGILRQIIFILCIVIFIPINSNAQKKILNYDVTYKGDIIGYLNLTELTTGRKVFYGLKSEVKASYIFSYHSYTNENSVFENGNMLYSFYYQKENGKEKINETRIAGNYFKLISDGNVDSQISNLIRFNILQLYGNCPGKSIKVYSTHYQRFLDFEKMTENEYRLVLPSGNYNYYHYKNGICTHVDVPRRFFTIHFILKKIQE